MYLNQLTVIGFTGQDLDFHFTSNITPVATLSVATKESWKAAGGDWKSHTEWHRIVGFGKLAEYAKTLTKGTRHGSGLAAFTRLRKGWCLASPF